MAKTIKTKKAGTTATAKAPAKKTVTTKKAPAKKAVAAKAEEVEDKVIDKTPAPAKKTMTIKKKVGGKKGTLKLKKKKPTKVVKVELSEEGKEIVQTIRNYQKEVSRKLGRVQSIQEDAFTSMFDYGKYLSDNELRIKEEFKTFGNLAKETGVHQSKLSRCKASYEDFSSHGITTAEQAINHLKELEVPATAKLLESNINRVLEAPRSEHEQRADRKRGSAKRNIDELKRAVVRTQEIIENNEPDSEIVNKARETMVYLEESVEYLASLDIYESSYNNPNYRELVRGLKKDMLTGDPIKSLDEVHFHHCDIVNWGTGGQGMKVPDMFGIPISGKTHKKLHEDKAYYSKEEVYRALIETMAHVIKITYPSSEVEMVEAEVLDEEEA